MGHVALISEMRDAYKMLAGRG